MERIFKAIISCICIAVLVFWCVAVVNAPINATKHDIEKVRAELIAQIDSVLQNQDSIKTELKILKDNTDTLKAGQCIIFKTMKENEGKSLLDLIFKK